MSLVYLQSWVTMTCDYLLSENSRLRWHERQVLPPSATGTIGLAIAEDCWQTCSMRSWSQESQTSLSVWLGQTILGEPWAVLLAVTRRLC